MKWSSKKKIWNWWRGIDSRRNEIHREELTHTYIQKKMEEEITQEEDCQNIYDTNRGTWSKSQSSLPKMIYNFDNMIIHQYI